MCLKFLTTEPKNSLFFHIHCFSQLMKKFQYGSLIFSENNYCSYASKKWFSILFLLKLNSSLHVDS